MDVDHVVPLASAHRSGGWRWSSDKKERYANYLGYAGHLAATTRRANRAKSDKGPENWRPDNRAHWCQYALDWIEIKRAWALTATPDEAEALRDMAKSCDFEVLIQAKRVEPPTRERRLGRLSAPRSYGYRRADAARPYRNRRANAYNSADARACVRGSRLLGFR